MLLIVTWAIVVMDGVLASQSTQLSSFDRKLQPIEYDVSNNDEVIASNDESVGRRFVRCIGPRYTVCLYTVCYTTRCLHASCEVGYYMSDYTNTKEAFVEEWRQKLALAVAATFIVVLQHICFQSLPRSWKRIAKFQLKLRHQPVVSLNSNIVRRHAANAGIFVRQIVARIVTLS